MEFLKALFKDGALTFEQFEAAAKEAKMNIVNLADGGYVSQAKFDDKVNTLTEQVKTLNGQIAQRDADMTTLRTNLEAAQADAGKLAGVQQSLTELQTKYANEKTAYEKQLNDQAYEFAVRERANSLKFSSVSAKKAFIHDAIAKGFKMDGETLLGYEDFVTKYKADDPGAFEAEKTPEPEQPQPRITAPTNPQNSGKHIPLSEMMRRRNENPDYKVNF